MDTKQNFVITVSRELGSGGRSIGRKLAERLGVRYCDKVLMQQLVEKFNLTTFEIEKIKAKKQNWFADFIEKVAPIPRADLVTGPRPGLDNTPLSRETTTEDIFKAESEILHAIAEEGSCVIAGRSGFFVLRDRPNKLDIFIRASKPRRIQRVMLKQGLSQEEAATVIDSVDQARDNYVSRFAGTSRYDARNYDLVLNVDKLSEDEAVDMILDYITRSE
ncbi:MAG: cytidylate kinase-like family protein [Bacteroidales bacterium]|nr:cytidylate kinase-like family protein [Bacteroidales bacterium]